MPQMMPLNWITMFIQITLILLIISLILTFLHTPSNLTTNLSPKTIKYNWSW